MTKRLITLLAALLVLGFVVAGCGDDESDSAGNGDTTAAETATDTNTATDDETVTGDVTETDTTTDTTTGTDTVTAEETETAAGGGAAAPTPPARTKENCEKGIKAAKQLSPDAREKLTGLCDEATSDDPDEVREAAREFCQTIVDSMYPEGRAGRDQALESCEQAGQQTGQ
jgi:hypothetical protein